MHITPEPQCSYVSFETNTCLPNYGALLRNALNIFRPKRFVVTMFSDEAVSSTMTELPMDPKVVHVGNVCKYVRNAYSSTKVESEMCCHMGCYSMESPINYDLSSSTTLKGTITSNIGFPTGFRRERSLTDLHD